MAEHQYEGRYADALLDHTGQVVTIVCDRRTANYIAVRLDGAPVPVLKRLRDRLDLLLTGSPASRAREAQQADRGA